MVERILSRRNFVKTSFLGALGFNFFCSRASKYFAMSKDKDLIVYVGTYTTGKSEGIYIGRLSLATGALTLTGAVKGITNPSYLVIDPHRRHLYAVNEILEYQGDKAGAVSAFSIDQQSFELKYLNQQSSHGSGPCYLSMDDAGSHVMVANFQGGNVAVLPVQKDGRLGEATEVIQHHGSSVNPVSQKAPHAHSIVLDRPNKHAIAADLGVDKLMIYRFDKRHGKLTPNDPPFVSIKPGSGPRHFTFHPNGRLAFVITERASTVTSFTYDPDTGSFKEVQTISTLPGDFAGVNYSADLHLSPSGKFLYGSNRGHDSIVVLAVNEKTGSLTPVQYQSTMGKFPRNFGIDPTGKFLLAANQESDTIVTFAIDQKTGKLTPTEHVAQVPSPVCIRFLRL